nr:MAG TPA: hypothetical protein [Caudoviricetes sp.]DAS44175.1 MAG TPA: hypothetical protein [Caudoviricetes sp.]
MDLIQQSSPLGELFLWDKFTKWHLRYLID